jgi:hypothetical protein
VNGGEKERGARGWGNGWIFYDGVIVYIVLWSFYISYGIGVDGWGVMHYYYFYWRGEGDVLLRFHLYVYFSRVFCVCNFLVCELCTILNWKYIFVIFDFLWINFVMSIMYIMLTCVLSLFFLKRQHHQSRSLWCHQNFSFLIIFSNI